MKWSQLAVGALLAAPVILTGTFIYDGVSQLFADCDPYCNVFQAAPIRSPTGQVAIVRREYTGGFVDDYDPVPNAVYVHGAYDRNTNDTMVLRYYSLEVAGSLPVVRWTGPRSLTVVVSAKSIVQVTREWSTSGGFTIAYRLPRAICPPTDFPYERPRIAQTCDYSKELATFVDALYK